MTQATADVPAKKEGTMPSPQKPADAGGRRVSYLPASIDEVNASIAAVWESTGTWKRLAQAVNSPDIKDRMLKLCNMQEMPLIGVDIIPTQQGLKLYINGEGAKYNRERYLAQNGRRLIERQIEIVPYEKTPGSDPARDKAQGRLYFKITTTCEDVDQKNKIVNAVASGIIKASEVTETLKALKIITESVTFSAYSNQSEKFSDNRQPDVILKKGITQCHRRADLEISSQCVIPEDEEPTDAQFLVKSEELLNKATAAAMADASLPKTTLVPDKATKQPDAPPAQAATAADAPAAKPGPVGEGIPAQQSNATEIESLMLQINGVFDKNAVKKADRIKWFTERNYPISKAKMTVDILKKALAEVTAQYAPAAPAAAPAAQEAPKEASAKPEPEKASPAKQEALKKIFGLREKSGFPDDESVRAWVKETFGKGLSEMDTAELGTVVGRVAKIVDTMSNHQKWGFASAPELLNYVQDSTGKPIYALDNAGLEKLAKDFDELV
jgi:hypothetical protein